MLATIIVPVAPGSRNGHCHADVQRRLAETFGGWTMHYGEGGWLSDNMNVVEQVAVYDVAMDDTPMNRETMRDIAHNVRSDLEQESVYLAFNTAVTAEFIGADSRPEAPLAAQLTQEITLSDL